LALVEVAGHELDPRPVGGRWRRGAADQPDLVSCRHQLGDQCAAEKTGASGDQDFHDSPPPPRDFIFADRLCPPPRALLPGGAAAPDPPPAGGGGGSTRPSLSARIDSSASWVAAR